MINVLVQQYKEKFKNVGKKVVRKYWITMRHIKLPQWP